MSTPRDRSPRSVPPLWAVLCFLVSGAAGLIYEVVWGKQLAYLLGGSLQSAATVVAAFLGGLALGARWIGPRLASRPGLARSYAWLELAVAALGLVLLPVLRSLDGVVGPLYRTLGGESIAFAWVRIALLFVLLVPPAALMGATLPVLVARIERGALGAGLAWLYAINTLGAVAGSVLAGFHLLPTWGLWRTTLVAACLNVLAAAVAWFGSGGARDLGHAPAAEPPGGAALPNASRRLMLGVFAASGAMALLLQLAWVRLFGLVFGSSVYSFSAVLGVYLVGLALGSALAAPLLARARSAAWAFALLQFAIAFAALLGIHAFQGLPAAMLTLGDRAGASWSGLLVGELGLVARVVLVPCLLLGAAFPLASRLLQSGAAGEATGRAYAANTLGTIAGSLLTGFVLMPRLGVQGVVVLAAAIALLSGLLAMALPGVSRPRLAPWTLALLLLLGSVVAWRTAPAWDARLMSLGLFRPFSAQKLLEKSREQGGQQDPARDLAATQQVLFYEDGINTSVLVATDPKRGKTWMRVGGKVDAGTGDMLTQVLLGLLPLCMAEPGASTLVVGHGSGVTAAAALAAGAGRTDIVELEPAVIAGSRFFHQPSEDPLRDPRVTLHLEDARTLLAHGAGRYDVIISEPSNPWVAGVNNLFTVDFYRQVRERLAEDGVFCQWVQLYELSPTTFQSLLASFLVEFPDAHLFCVTGFTDALLVAAPPGRTLSLDRLRDPALAFSYERAGITRPEQFAMFHVGSGEFLRGLAAGGELNTDDRPFVEYRAPRDLVEVGRTYGSHHPDLARLFQLPIEPPVGTPLRGWSRESMLEWRARQRLATLQGGDPEPVYAELRAAGAPELARRLAAEFERSTVQAELASAVQRMNEILAQGRTAEAHRIAEELLGLTTGRDRLEPLLALGISEFMAQRESESVRWFLEAQALAPEDVRAYQCEARLWIAARDPARAEAALRRGLQHAPGDSVLMRALDALSAGGTTRPGE